ncbi:hypothetical protein GCM10027161_31600 [Microbispora hainanensis]
MDELDRHAPAGAVHGRVDGPHAARTETADDQVWTDPAWITRQQRLHAPSVLMSQGATGLGGFTALRAASNMTQSHT